MVVYIYFFTNCSITLKHIVSVLEDQPMNMKNSASASSVFFSKPLTEPSEQLTTCLNSSLYPQHNTGSLWDTIWLPLGCGLQQMEYGRRKDAKWMTTDAEWRDDNSN